MNPSQAAAEQIRRTLIEALTPIHQNQDSSPWWPILAQQITTAAELAVAIRDTPTTTNQDI